MESDDQSILHFAIVAYRLRRIHPEVDNASGRYPLQVCFLGGMQPGPRGSAGSGFHRGARRDTCPNPDVTGPDGNYDDRDRPRLSCHRTGAPLAEVRPRRFSVHGQEITDDYAWLKAENWQAVLKDPAALPEDIAAYLKAENAFSESALAGTADLRRRLVAEMRGRIQEDESGVPERDGPFAYYTRHREGGQHPLVCRRPAGAPAVPDSGPDPDETILIDGDREGEGLPFFEIAAAVHSDDHARLAWSADTKGSELYTICVRDLATGQDLDDRVEATSGEAVWAGDGESFWYVAVDANHRPAKVMRHRLGTPQRRTRRSTRKPMPAISSISARRSPARSSTSRRATTRPLRSGCSTAHAAAATCASSQPREPLLIYGVEHRGDRLFILTNADGAEDFKIVTAPVDGPGARTGRTWCPTAGRADPRPASCSKAIWSGSRREDGLPRIVVRDLARRRRKHAVAFDEEAYSLGLLAGLEFDTDTIRFIYSSMTTPARDLGLRIGSRERTLLQAAGGAERPRSRPTT